MTQKDNGGSAFPAAAATSGHFEIDYGVTKRDYFASSASEKDVENYRDFGMDEFGNFHSKFSREQAKYRYADAMLEARNGAGEPHAD